MHKVFIDCDPGIDDALALAYLSGLHAAGEIELVGVSTTAGNVDAQTTARNAAYVLELADAACVPVAAGLPTPLVVPLVTTPETHGPEGLGYATVPDAPTCSDTHGVALSYAWEGQWEQLWLQAAAAGASLIVTGPLTNAASFAKRFPGQFAQFESVTVMGGAVNYPGNTTPTAEWNFWVDPDAAQQFFAQAERSDRLITLCSLGVTEQMLIGPGYLESLVKNLGNSPLAGLLPDALRFYFEFHESQGQGYQAQIHDLLTCMIALGTVEYSSVESTVRIEAASQLLRGTCVADLRGHWGASHNTHLVQSADIPTAHAELARAARILAARCA